MDQELKYAIVTHDDGENVEIFLGGGKKIKKSVVNFFLN